MGRIRGQTGEMPNAFNYAAITNFGVKHSKGEYILLMNNDVEVIEPDFIQEMLGFVQTSDVGICGAHGHPCADSSSLHTHSPQSRHHSSTCRYTGPPPHLTAP